MLQAPRLKPTSKRFIKRNLPVFEGTVDPAVTEEWISMIENIFEFVQIKDVDRVKCAVYMLKKDAKLWLDAVKKTRDVATMTQAKFLVEFNSKYYSQAVINSKVAEFTMLQQGSMSVLEYVRQFDQLSRYALDMVLAKTSKVWRFFSRLRPGLAGLVNTGRDGLESYADTVGRTIRQESWMKKEKKVNLSVGEGLKETTQQNQFQVYGNQ